MEKFIRELCQGKSLEVLKEIKVRILEVDGKYAGQGYEFQQALSYAIQRLSELEKENKLLQRGAMFRRVEMQQEQITNLQAELEAMKERATKERIAEVIHNVMVINEGNVGFKMDKVHWLAKALEEMINGQSKNFIKQ